MTWSVAKKTSITFCKVTVNITATNAVERHTAETHDVAMFSIVDIFTQNTEEWNPFEAPCRPRWTAMAFHFLVNASQCSKCQRCSAVGASIAPVDVAEITPYQPPSAPLLRRPLTCLNASSTASVSFDGNSWPISRNVLARSWAQQWSTDRTRLRSASKPAHRSITKRCTSGRKGSKSRSHTTVGLECGLFHAPLSCGSTPWTMMTSNRSCSALPISSQPKYALRWLWLPGNSSLSWKSVPEGISRATFKDAIATTAEITSTAGAARNRYGIQSRTMYFSSSLAESACGACHHPKHSMLPKRRCCRTSTAGRSSTETTKSTSTINPENNPKSLSGGMTEIALQKNATAVVSEVVMMAFPARGSMYLSLL
mmetsp:Transcript_66973/g.205102  ORF Transcript_66973/g.205102 Transcript_66973/m.205102 type:complete len:369 (-) Transcript_66973:1183-2289(-)